MTMLCLTPRLQDNSAQSSDSKQRKHVGVGRWVSKPKAEKRQCEWSGVPLSTNHHTTVCLSEQLCFWKPSLACMLFYAHASCVPSCCYRCTFPPTCCWVCFLKPKEEKLPGTAKAGGTIGGTQPHATKSSIGILIATSKKSHFGVQRRIFITDGLV